MRLVFAALLAGLSLSAAGLTPVDESSYRRIVAAQKGKVVLVNFWATYCVPCRKEMPGLVALHGKLGARGFQLLTVSADEPESLAEAAAFLDKNKVAAPVYLKKTVNDEKFFRAVDPKWQDGALPASFLYDKQGRKVRAFFGELNLSSLEAAIQKLL